MDKNSNIIDYLAKDEESKLAIYQLIVSAFQQVSNANYGGQIVDQHFLSKMADIYFEFNDAIIAGTTNEDIFFSLCDFENLIINVTDRVKNLYVEHCWGKVSSLDETIIVEKKKNELLGQGVKTKRWKTFARSIMTIGGKVNFIRTALRPSTPDDAKRLGEFCDKKKIFPLDEELGLDRLPFKISISAMLEIAYWVQLIPSYDGAKKAMQRNTMINVNEDTMRSVANHIGSLVFEAEKANAKAAWDMFETGRLNFPKEKRNYDLYLEVDGAMIHTRKPRNGNNPEIELVEGEHKSLWMENKLGMAFSSDEFEWWPDKNGGKQHRIGKREYISILGGVEEFKKHFLALALQNGYGTYKRTILISDGATWIRNMKEELFPDAYQILDFYHLRENITTFAKDIFDFDESKYKPWVRLMCNKFKESKYMDVLDEIKMFKQRVLNKSKLNIIKYIENNIKNIDYATYKANGWFIGSGAIESGNKTVVQRRLKQAGMRWNVESGQYILSLMAKAKSGRWETDVVNLVRNKYGSDGAFALLGPPLCKKPDYNVIDQRIQILKEIMTRVYYNTGRRFQ